ncbi:hypothetical protein NMY22_g8209 [Coprinellus aureogranulatus]|nr:hypothetical protein NMY22_g8209 [Coprinellus aureogranulatus]
MQAHPENGGINREQAQVNKEEPEATPPPTREQTRSNLKKLNNLLILATRLTTGDNLVIARRKLVGPAAIVLRGVDEYGADEFDITDRVDAWVEELGHRLHYISDEECELDLNIFANPVYWDTDERAAQAVRELFEDQRKEDKARGESEQEKQTRIQNTGRDEEPRMAAKKVKTGVEETLMEVDGGKSENLKEGTIGNDTYEEQLYLTDDAQGEEVDENEDGMLISPSEAEEGDNLKRKVDDENAQVHTGGSGRKKVQKRRRVQPDSPTQTKNAEGKEMDKGKGKKRAVDVAEEREGETVEEGHVEAREDEGESDEERPDPEAQPHNEVEGEAVINIEGLELYETPCDRCKRKTGQLCQKQVKKEPKGKRVPKPRMVCYACSYRKLRCTNSGESAKKKEGEGDDQGHGEANAAAKKRKGKSKKTKVEDGTAGNNNGGPAATGRSSGKSVDTEKRAETSHAARATESNEKDLLDPSRQEITTRGRRTQSKPSASKDPQDPFLIGGRLINAGVSEELTGRTVDKEEGPTKRRSSTRPKVNAVPTTEKEGQGEESTQEKEPNAQRPMETAINPTSDVEEREVRLTCSRSKPSDGKRDSKGSRAETSKIVRPAYEGELLQPGIPAVLERLVLDHHEAGAKISDVHAELAVVQLVQNELYEHVQGVNQTLNRLDVERQEGHDLIEGELQEIKSKIHMDHGRRLDDLEKRVAETRVDGVVVETLLQKNTAMDARIRVVESGVGSGRGNQGLIDMATLETVLERHRQKVKEDVSELIMGFETRMHAVFQQQLQGTQSREIASHRGREETAHHDRALEAVPAPQASSGEIGGMRVGMGEVGIQRSPSAPSTMQRGTSLGFATVPQRVRENLGRDIGRLDTKIPQGHFEEPTRRHSSFIPRAHQTNVRASAIGPRDQSMFYGTVEATGNQTPSVPGAGMERPLGEFGHGAIGHDYQSISQHRLRHEHQHEGEPSLMLRNPGRSSSASVQGVGSNNGMTSGLLSSYAPDVSLFTVGTAGSTVRGSISSFSGEGEGGNSMISNYGMTMEGGVTHDMGTNWEESHAGNHPSIGHSNS